MQSAPANKPPSLRQLFKQLPAIEASTPAVLDRLKRSKEFSAYSPRWSADGRVIHDGLGIRKCMRTGLEYSDPSLYTLIFFNRPTRQTIKLPASMGGISITSNLDCGYIYEHANISSRGATIYFANIVTSHGSVRFGTLGSGELGYHHSLAGVLPVRVVGCISGFSTFYAPAQLAEALGYTYSDVRGFLYRAETDIPVTVRVGYVPPGVDQQWRSTYVDMPQAMWLKLKNRREHRREYGIELEILCNGIAERVAVAKKAESMGWRAHGDCSIDPTCGIELNAPPYTYNDIMRDDGPWMTMLQFLRARAKGWSASTPGDREYGMHISMNRLAMTPATAAKVYACINGMHELCIQVAGRHSRWSKFFHERRGNESLPLPVGDALRVHLLKRGLVENGKGESASIRSSARLEVRMFRSCLNSDRLKRNVQLCDSIWSYSEQCSLRDAGNTEAYKAWLSDNQYLYPELASFIANLNPRTFKVTSSKVKKYASEPEVFA